MYVDGYLLLAIYFIAVLSLAVSTWAIWSLEEIRKHYERIYNKATGTYTFSTPVKKTVKK